MTRREVRDRVDALRTIERGTENDHEKEDEIYLDVLQAIATGTVADTQGIAAEALKTRTFIEHRWFA